MDWDDLRFVLAVARSRSLADAARTLGVAHSTVYRRIVAFETAHDVKLFDRLPTGYEPTEAANEIVRIAETMEKTVADAERRLLGHDRTLSGQVTAVDPDIHEHRLLIGYGERVRPPRHGLFQRGGDRVLRFGKVTPPPALVAAPQVRGQDREERSTGQ